jgi:hypothetical protein
MKHIFLLTGLLFLSPAAFAVPSVSGAILNEQGIVITGSGFGASNPMVFWDDSESTLKEHINSGANTDFPTEKYGSNKTPYSKPMQFDRTKSRAGLDAAPTYAGPGSKTYILEPKLQRTSDKLKKQIYVAWWYKPSKSPSESGGSNKFIRIWDEGNGKGTRISWTQMHFSCTDEENKVTWGKWEGEVGKWHLHEIFVDFYNNQIQTWVDGKRIHNADCGKNPNFPDNKLYVRLLGFDASLDNYEDMVTNIDNIYIADSQARVEISSSPKWAEQMFKEILPVVSWSDKKVVVRPVKGVVKTSSESYVYIVDEKGNVNANGYKLDCQICPQPPTPKS